jgi:hypothetical protein
MDIFIITTGYKNSEQIDFYLDALHIATARAGYLSLFSK